MDLITLTLMWIVGAIAGIAAVVKGCSIIWEKFGSKLWEICYEVYASHKVDLAFLEFQAEWLTNHYQEPVFIINDEIECEWGNRKLREVFDATESALLGRNWFDVVLESELESVKAKWREAIREQSNYKNVTTMIIGGKKVRMLVTAQAFIHGGKVRKFIGTVKVIG